VLPNTAHSGPCRQCLLIETGDNGSTGSDKKQTGTAMKIITLALAATALSLTSFGAAHAATDDKPKISNTQSVKNTQTGKDTQTGKNTQTGQNQAVKIQAGRPPVHPVIRDAARKPSGGTTTTPTGPSKVSVKRVDTATIGTRIGAAGAVPAKPKIITLPPKTGGKVHPVTPVVKTAGLVKPLQKPLGRTAIAAMSKAHIVKPVAKIIVPVGTRPRYTVAAAPKAGVTVLLQPFVQRPWRSAFTWVIIPTIGYVTVPERHYQTFYSYVNVEAPNYQQVARLLAVAAAEDEDEQDD
jgi:hypothetical protein